MSYKSAGPPICVEGEEMAGGAEAVEVAFAEAVAVALTEPEAVALREAVGDEEFKEAVDEEILREALFDKESEVGREEADAVERDTDIEDKAAVDAKVLDDAEERPIDTAEEGAADTEAD